MKLDKLQAISNLTMRQKVTGGVLALIVIVVLWQIIGLFGGGGRSNSDSKITPVATSKPSAKTTPVTVNAGRGSQVAPIAANTPQMSVPQPATTISKQEVATTQREMELMKLQQETEAKYIAALNELQMLKVSREIAETNRAIMAAKLATVTAQKNIVKMLSGPTPEQAAAGYAKNLVDPTKTITVQPTVNYTVISVTQLRNKWSAVLGYSGSLYNVSVGDVLPVDGSKVASIDKSGVLLEKDNMQKKISLVPII